MRFEGYAQALRSELEVLLQLIESPPAFREMVREALSQPGKILCGEAREGWAVLPLAISEAIGGSYEKCVPAGVALELLLAAGDKFDDIEDRAFEGTAAYGINSQAVNVGTALLMLTQVAIARLRRVGVEPDVILKVVAAIGEAGLKACAGQHYDLTFESRIDVSLDDCLRMVEWKSASLMEAACRAGALLATENPEVIFNYAQFGHNLGMAARITNDVLAFNTAYSARSDIERRKKTLPVVYALNNVSRPEANFLHGIYSQRGKVSLRTCQRICSALRGTGAIHFALTAAEVYKLKALKALEATGIDNPINQDLKAAVLE